MRTPEDVHQVFWEQTRQPILEHLMKQGVSLSAEKVEHAGKVVAEAIAHADFEYMTHVVPQFPKVPDPYGVGTLFVHHIRKGTIGYRLHSLDVAEANTQTKPVHEQFAVAEDMYSHAPVFMQFGEHQTIIAPPAARTRYMAGAAASFRIMNQFERRGDPIGIALGDRTFVSQVGNELGSPDLDFVVQSDKEAQFAMKMAQNLVLAGHSIMLFIQDGTSYNLKGAIRLLLDTDEKAKVTAIVGMLPSVIIRSEPTLLGIIKASHHVLFGAIPVQTSMQLGIDEKNAAHILPTISQSMLWEITSANRNGEYGIARYFPLWRRI